MRLYVLAWLELMLAVVENWSKLTFGSGLGRNVIDTQLEQEEYLVVSCASVGLIGKGSHESIDRLVLLVQSLQAIVAVRQCGVPLF